MAPLTAVIGLGGNLGDRLGTLAAAALAVEALPGVQAQARSCLYETDPVGPPQPDFLNAALRVTYVGSPLELLALLQGIERRFGRVRRERWAARTLDLDLLWIEGRLVSLPDLVVPHPGLLERRFALEPLLDVAKDALDPRTGRRLSEVLAELPAGGVRRIAGPGWVEAGAAKSGPD
jgi:2-amino-4-hydroxy-6-hydroxymethyldihydropteridine diphosphokinase